MKILIVEDSAAMRRMMRALLAPLTAQVVECADGREALAAYVEHRPGWVLMDIGLKHTDGISATRLLRAADSAARIIIVTDYDEPEWREAARAAGARGYVLKDNLLELRGLLQSTAAEESERS